MRSKVRGFDGTFSLENGLVLKRRELAKVYRRTYPTFSQDDGPFSLPASFSLNVVEYFPQTFGRNVRYSPDVEFSRRLKEDSLPVGTLADNLNPPRWKPVLDDGNHRWIHSPLFDGLSPFTLDSVVLVEVEKGAVLGDVYSLSTNSYTEIFVVPEGKEK
jgi:hypothetical protein